MTSPAIPANLARAPVQLRIGEERFARHRDPLASGYRHRPINVATGLRSLAKERDLPKKKARHRRAFSMPLLVARD
jgi:hypothetical protein